MFAVGRVEETTEECPLSSVMSWFEQSNGCNGVLSGTCICKRLTCGKVGGGGRGGLLFSDR